MIEEEVTRRPKWEEDKSKEELELEKERDDEWKKRRHGRKTRRR